MTKNELRQYMSRLSLLQLKDTLKFAIGLNNYLPQELSDRMNLRPLIVSLDRLVKWKQEKSKKKK